MESKYRYRNVSDFELTGQPIPADAKERKQEYLEDEGAILGFEFTPDIKLVFQIHSPLF